jgi:benzoate transport
MSYIHEPKAALSPVGIDIKSIIDERKMTALQYTTIFICFLMNMLDGMDVMIISYAAPSIAKAWTISPEALGIVFSAGLLGMTVGTMFLAPKTDVIGRRPMILLCAALMGSSVFATAYTQSVNQLVLLRFLSGLGIGGMLASTPALASEYAPDRSKDFWVSLVMSGYPSGAVVSGIVAAEIIPGFGWQAIFQVAGIATLLTIPLIYFLAAESLDFLFKTRPRKALEKANRILEKMSVPQMTELPPVEAQGERAKASVVSLFTKNYKVATLRLWVAFFMSFASLYFLISWIPKLAESTGLSLELAIYAGTVFNLGSIPGISLQGYLSGKFGLSRVVSIFLSVAAFLMIVFGFFKGSAVVLILFGLIGFTFQGGFVGLYAMAARLYPTEFRTTGIGWAIGFGRSGGVVGPLLGGILIGMGLTMTANFIVYAIPVVIAGITALFISVYQNR